MIDISIIIPVYNKEKYIEKCLISLENQIFKNFEVIIVNNKSTDNSVLICKKFIQNNKNYQLIDLNERGVSNARNIGIEKARGKYIQFIDADDYIDANMLSELMNIVDKYNPELILSGIRKVNHKHEIIKEIVPKYLGAMNKDDFFSNFAEIQRKTGLYGYISNKLINRKLIEKNSLRFNVNIKLAEDLDFYINVYKYVTKVYVIRKAFYNYVQQTENSSTDGHKKNDYITQIGILIKEQQMLKENNSLNCENKINLDIIISNFILCFIYEFNKTSYKEMIDYINLLSIINIKDNIYYKDKKISDKLVLVLLKNNYKFILYLYIRVLNIIKRIYRKFKYNRG